MLRLRHGGLADFPAVQAAQVDISLYRGLKRHVPSVHGQRTAARFMPDRERRARKAQRRVRQQELGKRARAWGCWCCAVWKMGEFHMSAGGCGGLGGMLDAGTAQQKTRVDDACPRYLAGICICICVCVRYGIFRAANIFVFERWWW